MNDKTVVALLVVAFSLIGSASAQTSSSPEQAAQELTVAVASNFRLPLEQVVAASPYWSTQNIKLVTGSTGTLYAQIINGAPFDVFLSADSLRPMALVKNNLADQSHAYAIGRLALWPVPNEIMINRMVTQAKIMRMLEQHQGKFAIAHPDLAPYGLAAKKYLTQYANNEELLQNLVLGSNVTQAFQLVDSGNASMGMVAESLLIEAYKQFQNDKYKRYLIVEPEQNSHDAHASIMQQHLVILNSSEQKGRAQAFVDFLLSDKVQLSLSQLGYTAIRNTEAHSTPASVLSNEANLGEQSKVSSAHLLNNWQAITLTLKLAALTVIVLLIIGLPFAWWLARYNGIFKPFIEALVALPLVLPPTVLGFYLLSAFSPNTFVGSLWINIVGDQFVFSFIGILVGSIIYSLPFVIQPLLVAFTQLANSALISASTLGISPVKRFIYVILPMAKNSLITAITLGFAHTLGEFGLVLMIGGNIPGETQVVSIALFNQVESLEYAQAHQLALVLLVASLLSLSLLYKFNRKTRPLGIGA